ncbi:IclR family transcriptional regulator [Bifidobacterium callimiconis]|uniref:Glycerol operon regulatory protein n=2 Tax=Bifidobacterium callimiconis TaxID=2306973 RepID=A0A430FHT1_9BIFI|nr:IclR family transcriptional regulator [Bifidobacterium callimiconis]
MFLRRIDAASACGVDGAAVSDTSDAVIASDADYAFQLLTPILPDRQAVHGPGFHWMEKDLIFPSSGKSCKPRLDSNVMGTSNDACRNDGRRTRSGMVDRVFAILDCFTSETPRLNLTQLASRSGLPVSTTSRILTDLERHGVVERLRGGEYSIGMHLMELAQLARPLLSIREDASPCLDELNRITGMHVQLAVLDGPNVTIIDRRDGKQKLPIYYHIGDSMPPIPTAVGRVLLAYANPALISEVVDRDDFTWPSFDSPRPSVTAVHRELDIIRRNGVALFAPDGAPVHSVAAPIYDRTGAVAAAIAVVTNAESMPSDRVVALVKGAAVAITKRLAAPPAQRVLPSWEESNISIR